MPDEPIYADHDEVPDPDPFARFERALAHAKKAVIGDATAMALATVARAGDGVAETVRPAVRIVLLKSADTRGFTFFTNYGGRKAREIAENPFGALCFFWPLQTEQVRIEGRIEKLPAAESDAYFATRPFGSQIAAWASIQSEPMSSRVELDARVRKFESRFAGKTVPRPDFWGGYLLVPDRIEFWRAACNRLHYRNLYERDGESWRLSILYP